MSQQRASVKKLTPRDLKLLAKTDFNLGELYKLKTLPRTVSHVEEHTFNNWNYMGSVLTVSATQELPSIHLPSQLKELIEQQSVVKTEDFLENEESVDRYFNDFCFKLFNNNIFFFA